jgi:hypothetical protein
VSTGGGAPTGTVSFMDGGTSIGSGSVSTVSTTNLVPYSQISGLTGWNAYCGNSSNLTPDSGDLAAPDGSFTSLKVAMPAGGLQCSGSYGAWGAYGLIPGGLVAGNTYTISVWMRGAAGGETGYLALNDGGDYTYLRLTTTWQRYTATFSNYVSVGGGDARGWQFHGDTSGQTFYIWGPQTELSSSEGPYVATGVSSQAGSGGIATYTTSLLSFGSHSITAVYGGDSNYTGSTSPAIAQQVNQDSQTITFAQPTTPVTYGVSSSTLSATATSGLTVTFTTTGPCSVSVSTLTITGAGSCVITANQAGNSNYTAATAVAHTITVNQASLTITASSAALSYKSSVPTITPSYATFVNSDTAASLTTAPTCTTAYTATTSVSASPVTTSCSGAVDPNYYDQLCERLNHDQQGNSDRLGMADRKRHHLRTDAG